MLDNTFTIFGYNLNGKEAFVVVKNSEDLSYFLNKSLIKKDITWDRIEPRNVLDDVNSQNVIHWTESEWREAEWAFWGNYNNQRVVICSPNINNFINLPAETEIEVCGSDNFINVAKGSVEWDNIELLTPVD